MGVEDIMFKVIKNNDKSIRYESDEYLVEIRENKGFVLKRNGTDYTDYDYDLGEDDLTANKSVNLKITNKKTRRSSSKRCYQGFDVIDDVEKDINGNKVQFKSIFTKID